VALFLLGAQHMLSACRVRVVILCAISGYFLRTANLGGDRLDALLVKIPAERFSGR
jgi:hypothetical protein